MNRSALRIRFCSLSSVLSSALLAACAGTPWNDRVVHPRVSLQTSLGDIVLVLDREHAPQSTANFLHYVAEKHYDGTQFHRVIAGFVVQGGGYDINDRERPQHAPIPLEAGNGLSNRRGTLAMAREEAPNTATAEFYINLVDNLKLDPHPEIPGREWGYAVFGQVQSGMDVVDRIAAQATGARGPFDSDVPVTPVLILRARRLPDPPA